MYIRRGGISRQDTSPVLACHGRDSLRRMHKLYNQVLLVCMCQFISVSFQSFLGSPATGVLVLLGLSLLCLTPFPARITCTYPTVHRTHVHAHRAVLLTIVSTTESLLRAPNHAETNSSLPASCSTLSSDFEKH